jgi:ribosome-associated translation inhibitor RaiA/cold shock CspA family protein
MQVPLDITFENSEPSEAIRSEVEKQAKRLEKFDDRITSCNVAVIAPQARHRKGGLFKIDIRIAMPEHKDIIVTKTHGDTPEHEHVVVAIKDAFAAAQRQIEDAVREMRGQVKPHEAEDHGRVSKFMAGDDYGFIKTADGREIYFHRNSVFDDTFDRLTVGSEVRFVEEMGERARRRAPFARLDSDKHAAVTILNVGGMNHSMQQQA